jgi:hypothetical protein
MLRSSQISIENIQKRALEWMKENDPGRYEELMSKPDYKVYVSGAEQVPTLSMESQIITDLMSTLPTPATVVKKRIDNVKLLILLWLVVHGSECIN